MAKQPVRPPSCLTVGAVYFLWADNSWSDLTHLRALSLQSWPLATPKKRCEQAMREKYLKKKNHHRQVRQVAGELNRPAQKPRFALVACLVWRICSSSPVCVSFPCRLSSSTAESHGFVWSGKERGDVERLTLFSPCSSQRLTASLASPLGPTKHQITRPFVPPSGRDVGRTSRRAGRVCRVGQHANPN